MLRRIFIIALLLMVVVWIVSNPAVAGDTVRGWINSFTTFFQHISGS
ncbi:MAG: hypothetical protein ABJB47_09420 [Actinomycetota bacterium]